MIKMLHHLTVPAIIMFREVVFSNTVVIGVQIKGGSALSPPHLSIIVHVLL